MNSPPTPTDDSPASVLQDLLLNHLDEVMTAWLRELAARGRVMDVGILARVEALRPKRARS